MNFKTHSAMLWPSLTACALVGALTLTACDGGDYALPTPPEPEPNNSTTNNTGPSQGAPATLNADQQTYEKAALASSGGYYDLSWFLTWDPTKNKPGENYIAARQSSLAASPLQGSKRLEQSAWLSVARTPDLAPPESLDGNANDRGPWIVHRGDFVNPHGAEPWIRYQGDKILHEGFLPGQTFPLWTYRIQTTELPLRGTLGDAPEEFKKFLTPMYFEGRYLDPTRPFAENASFFKMSWVFESDQTGSIDCAKPTGTSPPTGPTPCLQGTNLQDALSRGLADQDGKLHYLGDGTPTKISDLNAWVSKTPVVNSAHPRKYYRAFIEKNGAIYVGYTYKAGTPATVLIYKPGPDATDSQIEYLTFRAVLNPAAFESLKNAMRL